MQSHRGFWSEQNGQKAIRTLDSCVVLFMLPEGSNRTRRVASSRQCSLTGRTAMRPGQAVLLVAAALLVGFCFSELRR